MHDVEFSRIWKVLVVPDTHSLEMSGLPREAAVNIVKQTRPSQNHREEVRSFVFERAGTLAEKP